MNSNYTDCTNCDYNTNTCSPGPNPKKEGNVDCNICLSGYQWWPCSYSDLCRCTPKSGPAPGPSPSPAPGPFPVTINKFACGDSGVCYQDDVNGTFTSLAECNQTCGIRPPTTYYKCVAPGRCIETDVNTGFTDKGLCQTYCIAPPVPPTPPPSPQPPTTTKILGGWQWINSYFDSTAETAKIGQIVGKNSLVNTYCPGFFFGGSRDILSGGFTIIDNTKQSSDPRVIKYILPDEVKSGDNVFITLGGVGVVRPPSNDTLIRVFSELQNDAVKNGKVINFGLIYDMEGWLFKYNIRNDIVNLVKSYRILLNSTYNLVHIACPRGSAGYQSLPTITPDMGFDYIAPMLYYEERSYQSVWTFNAFKKSLCVHMKLKVGQKIVLYLLYKLRRTQTEEKI